uniref:Si:dkey-1j5.4 n=1 Tax=Seriola dumerili TaxID=41447 RepID=A0A3B4TZV3_SERDU
MQYLQWLLLVILWGAQTVESCPDVCKCSKMPDVEKSEVNCHKKGLQDFPSDLPPDAWILKLGEYFSSIHPKAFSGAKQLMLLNLNRLHVQCSHCNNLIRKVFLLPRLKDLLNLRFLMLGQNQIGTLKAEMFAGLRNLSDLDLPLNALTSLPSNAFKPLIALKVLDLSLNRIERISPKAFTGLRQLMFLNLDNNRSQEHTPFYVNVPHLHLAITKLTS